MRKTTTLTITDENRDKGKTFLITEMSAYQAESWATKALLAVSNIDIPENLKGLGMEGLAKLGLKFISTIDYETVKPILNEMLECVQIVMPAITRPLVDNDIEEISTILKLRQAVFELHTGFSLADLPLILGSDLAAETTES